MDKNETVGRADCEDLRSRILETMRQGITRYRARSHVEDIRELINQYSHDCDADMGQYFLLNMGHQFSLTPMHETIAGFKKLLETSSADQVQVLCLNQLARLTFKRIPIDENCKYRVDALAIAHSSNMKREELVILNNWAFALLSSEQIDSAEEKTAEIDTLVQRLTQQEHEDPLVHEAVSRYMTHKAKLLVLKACRHPLEHSASRIAEANALYEQAIERDQEVDHRRVNEQIEWASELLRAHSSGLQGLAKVWSILEAAHSGLDSHECDHCRAYYHQICAEFKEAEGVELFPHDRGAAVSSWSSAIEECERSIQFYRKVQHTLIKEPIQLKEIIKRRLEMEARSRKVFLSHKGADKELAREIKKTLDALGYEPWLDEDALLAGQELERSLLRGFKESCAAVFLITSNFKDEGYLATEINYAVAEKRKKGDQFVIISLVFDDGEKGTIAVPELLEQYVWKHPQNLLDALRQIVAALPLKPATPVWRK